MEVDLTQFSRWSEALEAAPQGLHKQNLASTRVALGQGVVMAKENAPFQDGDLSANIRILSEPHMAGGGYTGEYGTDLEYSAQREYGGTIYPRNGGLLVFHWEKAQSADNPEGLVFARSVTQEGSFYMQRSADALEPKLPRIYMHGITLALDEVGL